MSKTEILSKLRELHQDLTTLNERSSRPGEAEIDQDTIEALGQLISDASLAIDRQYQSNHSVEDLSPNPNDNELANRIEQFESDHPQVTQFLSQIGDLLASIGI